MATTPEQSKQDQDEFEAAFAGEHPSTPEMTEDEAFGMSEEPSPEDHAIDDQTSAAESGDGGEGGVADETPAVAIVIEPGATDDADIEEEPTDPKELQRKKSWEGRLKAREAELKAREEAAAKPAEAAMPVDEVAEAATGMQEEGETPAEEAAEPMATEKMEDIVEQVQSGEMTADQAMEALGNDFGPDFPKMLAVLIKAQAGEIAGKAVDEKVAGVKQNLDGLIGELKDEKQRMHFESIADAHPDFIQVGKSPEFKAFVDALPEADKEAALQTIGNGSARQINALLTSFKKSSQPQDKPDEAAMNAAEGVRSGGLKLPNPPAQSQDYEDAWDSF